MAYAPYLMASEEKRGWHPDQLRKYDLNIEEIPRLEYSDARVDEFIAKDRPVVITGTCLVAPAAKWTLEYLAHNIGQGEFTVYFSKNHVFKYFDEKKVKDYTGKFNPPTHRLDMKFPEFVRYMKQWKAGNDRPYLQQALNSTAGPSIVEDFRNFNWDWVNNLQKKHTWGPLTSNLMLIAMEGNVTPCHYDEQQNIFAQVYGYKRCILFHPDQFDCLYPHPIFHPHDRQTQVDFENPNYERYPKFPKAKAMQAVAAPPPPISYPLLGHQKIAIMRNVEKMLAEALQDQKEVGPLLRALVLGRYT
ncbi:hypothetical protein B566_EDAN008276 [Ephemera danica]|nr:hypothetical protein B566_EDAN008276 [Ephemera danica]